jgi:hypothetical protein
MFKCWFEYNQLAFTEARVPTCIRSNAVISCPYSSHHQNQATSAKQNSIKLQQEQMITMTSTRPGQEKRSSSSLLTS